ncbi:transcriptional regulator [Microbacterium protaetiae]|uniref:Transcriptional regulator n=1 Tax=Microbacterium protaetiae TaxID=2509458 RepID=A0A4P6EG03_9MICO|nr:helix-turn-helix domain-containing protein [Microbacterium protaetiae]QAY60343.1 transcriptional regulator [Microbacterium protaetiae]
MLGRTYDGEVCSIARSLEVIGERWTLLIIRNALFAGVTRFGDFQRRLGIATNVLTSRLDGLVAADVMEKSHTTTNTEYLLTEKGRDLSGVLVALTDWGDRWAAPDGPPIIYRHGNCDGAVHSRLACDTCGGQPDAVTASPGPGMPEERWTGAAE